MVFSQPPPRPPNVPGPVANVAGMFSRPVLALTAAVVWAVAVLLAVFVAAPLLLGMPVNIGFITGVLSPIASFTGVFVALWIALSERKALRDASDEVDKRQAGLVKVSASLAGLGSDDVSVAVRVRNFGTLPILDVVVTELLIDGQEVTDFQISRGPVDVILAQDQDSFGVRPADATKLAPGGDLTVAVQFTDWSDKRWKRTNKGGL